MWNHASLAAPRTGGLRCYNDYYGAVDEVVGLPDFEIDLPSVTVPVSKRTQVLKQQPKRVTEGRSIAASTGSRRDMAASMKCAAAMTRWLLLHWCE